MRTMLKKHSNIFKSILKIHDCGMKCIFDQHYNVNNFVLLTRKFRRSIQQEIGGKPSTPGMVETIDGILGSLSNSFSGQIMHGCSLFWSKVENCCHLYECIAYMIVVWNCPLKTSVHTQVHTRMSRGISGERIVEIRTVSDR
ncbi:hypothetical protein T03_10675 [Trichinella britovi]|uniref:Uncharacterized protein n=1 Tax=Trichinella britovi TaxID=45882 RepID=A0A0V1CSB0_TRIBR|nr:hypothetical protein T03_10675 [Trichinella britovi]